MSLHSIYQENREINYITVNGYYPVNWLAKIQISGYIRYPDTKNY